MNRVLPDVPYETLQRYVDAGGGAGLAAARAVAPETVIEEIVASGLRGRGGAGFPTGVKWRTVRSFASPLIATTVVVNAAEGEPGTFKDRAILRANPYAVLEGALVAAHAVAARSVVVATKAAFAGEVARLRAAVHEVRAAGWLDDVEVEVVEGPSAYLLGEETALLEVIDGRPPFPRVAPPFRRGVVEVAVPGAAGPSGATADVQMAETDAASAAPPVLVNNVETMANVAAIIARGADWFRSIGTAESPGSIVCTVTGAVRRPTVVEVPMGTALQAVIDLAGGVQQGRAVAGVMVGVSSAVIAPDLLATPVAYETMTAIGSGLGSAGFVVVGDDVDPVALAAGVSRFLSVESCGQCTHCKEDGEEIAVALARIVEGGRDRGDLQVARDRLATVADGRRCSLAEQHQVVVGSVLDTFATRVEARLASAAAPVAPYVVAPLVDIGEHGAVIDETFADKRDDWSYGGIDTGKAPADRFTTADDVEAEAGHSAR